MSKVTVTVEPVCVSREVAAEMLGMSLAHWERHVQPALRLVRSGRLRLVPVEELKAWVRSSAHAPIAAGA